MRNFDYKDFYGFNAKGLNWIRIVGLGYGVSLIKKLPLFSERYGFIKYVKVFGWRVRWLRAK